MPIVLDGTTGITYPSGAVSASGITYASGLTGATPSLGDGQTWSNVTGSRSIGTTYTNTTGKPLAWFIGMAGGYYVFVTIGGTSFSGYSNTGGTWIIPSGATYLVNSIQAGSIAQWMELR